MFPSWTQSLEKNKNKQITIHVGKVEDPDLPPAASFSQTAL